MVCCARVDAAEPWSALPTSDVVLTLFCFAVHVTVLTVLKVIAHWLRWLRWLGAVISRVHCLARHTGGGGVEPLLDVKDIVTW